MVKHREYEHSQDLREAQEAMTVLRKRIGRLHFFSGGKGYDNMGRRELQHVRDRVDEADFWLAAASRSLNAGGKRAEALGFSVERPGCQCDGVGCMREGCAWPDQPCIAEQAATASRDAPPTDGETG